MEFITFEVEASGLRRKMRLLAASAKDLRRPLARSGGLLRTKAERIFEAQGPGWEPLAESTLDLKPTERMSQFLATSKGGRSGVRTTASLSKRIARGERTLARSSRGRAARVMERLQAQRAQLRDEAVWLSEGARRKFTPATLMEFAVREVERRRLRGLALKAAKTAATPEERERLLRQHKPRYQASTSAHRMLGALDRTITMKLVRNQAVEIFSKAKIGAIHNYGDVAGHGVKIPARPFMYLESVDLERMVEFFKEHLLLAWLT